MGGMRSSWAGKHERELAARKEDNAMGKAHFSVPAARTCVQVSVPYHPDWPQTARELGGKWKDRSRFWTFPLKQLRTVLNALVRIYGLDILWPVWAERRAELNNSATLVERMRDGV